MSNFEQSTSFQRPSRIRALVPWALAVVLTLASVVFQRVTGPTYPIRGSYMLAGEKIRYKLPRSHGGESGAVISIPAPTADATGVLRYRRFKVNEPFKETPLQLEGGHLSATLPHQPPAGKLEYQLLVNSGAESVFIPCEHTADIRFKGDVSAWVLVPHIFLMFFGMLLAVRAGIEALQPDADLRLMAWWAFGLLTAGGMLLGPIVQQQAFGAYWTGVPFDWDLTDNKTLIAFGLWLVACISIGTRSRPVSSSVRWLTFAAALLTIVVFMIPHSMFGSRLDYTKIDQGISSSQSINTQKR